MKIELPSSDAIRAILSDAARVELIPRFNRVRQETKRDGSLVSEADRAAQRHVAARVRELTPHIPLLGEESTEDETRALMAAAEATFWCLDPLDGTTNFASGVPFYSISLALIQNRRAVLGAIHDPQRDELFFARSGEGATLNGAPLGGATGGPRVALEHGVGLVDFKRLPAPLAQRLATQPPYASQRSFGSVALDWCWIAAGRGHVYVHGKQKIWDYAAGTLILEEAGGRSSTLDGQPVFDGSYADRSAVAALHPHVYAEWFEWLRGAGAQ
jgi:myo-inositol-1(or 4)-monophosphatase